MSYDLMAFESDKAPKKYKDFLRWYDEQTEWNGEHDYNNPSLASDDGYWTCPKLPKGSR